MSSSTEERPALGSLVAVRGRKWGVSDIDHADGGTLMPLQNTDSGRIGEPLSVLWEIEPGRRVLPRDSLSPVSLDRFAPPERLAALLDAVRWSAVASADTRTLQAPFRSSVAIEDYQLEPVTRAVRAPRVNQLLADDVGLGKTVEAGLDGVDLWHWPTPQRAEKGAKSHAKLAVADRRVLLVSSANLTQSGVARNIEAGLLVRGGDAPRRVAEHIAELRARKVLARLSAEGSA